MSLSTDCRVASLEAFLQARAMGTGTNAGGGVLAGAGDCGRDEDGKFGGGNKCAGDGGLDPSEKLKSAVVRWKGSTSDIGIHVQDEIDGKPVPNSGTGKKLREMAASLLKEVKENGAPAPTLYRGDDKPPEENTSPLLGWTSNKQVAEKWASRYGGQVYTLEGAVGVELKKIAGETLDGGEKEWIVLNRGKSRRSLPADARYASLIAFAQARDCGRDPDGKFSSGNTCAGGVLAEAAQGAATGAVKGAITGLLAGGPATVKPGAAIGAGVGAVKGIYDNQMRPTRVKRTIENLGMTSNQVGSLVEKLGGTPNSSADTKGSVLRLTIRGKDGKKSFHVEVDKKTITVYPRRPSGELNGREIVRLKKIADESTPKSISVVVKKSSSAYVAKLVKNGFTMAAGHAADVLVANYATPLVHSVASDVYQSLRKKLS
jgi:hypothetical protein